MTATRDTLVAPHRIHFIATAQNGTLAGTGSTKIAPPTHTGLGPDARLHPWASEQGVVCPDGTRVPPHTKCPVGAGNSTWRGGGSGTDWSNGTASKGYGSSSGPNGGQSSWGGPGPAQGNSTGNKTQGKETQGKAPTPPASSAPTLGPCPFGYSADSDGGCHKTCKDGSYASIDGSCPNEAPPPTTQAADASTSKHKPAAPTCEDGSPPDHDGYCPDTTTGPS